MSKRLNLGKPKPTSAKVARVDLNDELSDDSDSDISISVTPTPRALPSYASMDRLIQDVEDGTLKNVAYAKSLEDFSETAIRKTIVEEVRLKLGPDALNKLAFVIASATEKAEGQNFYIQITSDNELSEPFMKLLESFPKNPIFAMGTSSRNPLAVWMSRVAKEVRNETDIRAILQNLGLPDPESIQVTSNGAILIRARDQKDKATYVTSRKIRECIEYRFFDPSDPTKLILTPIGHIYGARGTEASVIKLLHEHFSIEPKLITSVDIPRKTSGKARGFAAVYFVDTAVAKRHENRSVPIPNIIDPRIRAIAKSKQYNLLKDDEFTAVELVKPHSREHRTPSAV
jgi:hypothetical protein